MSKFEYLNLTQKMIKIRKMVPKLIRKRYSEEVPYDFVRLDDIYEYLTPALTKYGVDFEVLTEKPTQVDSSGNQVYLIPFGNLWRYEADLKLCWVNADRPNEKSYSDIHVVGTNEVPDKANLSTVRLVLHLQKVIICRKNVCLTEHKKAVSGSSLAKYLEKRICAAFQLDACFRKKTGNPGSMSYMHIHTKRWRKWFLSSLFFRKILLYGSC